MGVVGAASVDQDLLGLELFAAVAIETGVRFLKMSPASYTAWMNLRQPLWCRGLAGLDEVVERDFEGGPDLAKLTRHVVDVRLGLHPEFAVPRGSPC